jgi:hypothetical protein
MAARDPGQVMAILHSLLPTNLRSLAIILRCPVTYTITRINICYNNPTITTRLHMRLNADILALKLWLFCQSPVPVHSWDRKLTCFTSFCNTWRHGVNNCEYICRNRILKNHDCEAWSIHNSIIQLSLRRLWNRAQRPMGAQGASRILKMMITRIGQDTLTLPMCGNQYNHFIWVQTPFLNVNRARSPPQACTTDGMILPWLPQYFNSKANLSDAFQLSTVITPILLFERSAPISVCMFTNSSSTLEEAHIQMHSTANLWLLKAPELNLVRLQCTYSWETLWMKHSDRHKCLHEWSTLMEMTSYEWSTTTTTDVCTSKAHLRRRHPTIEVHWEGESFSQLKRTYSCDPLHNVKCM